MIDRDITIRVWSLICMETVLLLLENLFYKKSLVAEIGQAL